MTGMKYFLAKKEKNRTAFVCGDDPGTATIGFSIDGAKEFESPADALAFRAGMPRHWQSKFIVHEFDGSVLHSLDV